MKPKLVMNRYGILNSVSVLKSLSELVSNWRLYVILCNSLPAAVNITLQLNLKSAGSRYLLIWSLYGAVLIWNRYLTNNCYILFVKIQIRYPVSAPNRFVSVYIPNLLIGIPKIGIHIISSLDFRSLNLINAGFCNTWNRKL